MLSTKSSLSALGERFKRGAERAGDRELLQEYREWRAAAITSEFAQIAGQLQMTPGLLGCRIKRTDTIIRKLLRERAMDLVRMDDVIGFRILVASLATQAEVVRGISSVLPIHRVRDYIQRPSPTGYRGVHLIVRQRLTLPTSESITDFSYEVQIRTAWQHLWATTSESFGEQVKEGGGTEAQRAYLVALSARVTELENAEPSLVQMDGLKSGETAHFVVLDFDKADGVLLGGDNFGTDIAAAIQYYVYLENRHRADLRHETVLLGVSQAQDAAKTHLRYFSPRGVPPLPAELELDVPRPV